ncbi:QueT transporter family protein [Oenococcus alcoholitolerans]|uniref:QueT transporter family protein n=1 Tax=Oenococcus alcoholitolerans TaxID=931074 RepID=UPI003F725078
MKKSSRNQARDITLVGAVAALYILVGMIPPLNLRGGAIQIRPGEGFNNLVIFNKRYIAAQTIGVFIFNLFFGLGIIDAIVGGLQTLVMTWIVYQVTKRIKNTFWKFAASTLIVSLFMFWIAAELVIFFPKLANGSFWATYGSLFISEFISMVVGSIIIYAVSKVVDLSK